MYNTSSEYSMFRVSVRSRQLPEKLKHAPCDDPILSQEKMVQKWVYQPLTFRRIS